ncbi:2-oxoglutarate-dependent dioxygenase AOP1.2 [Populus alba x Populus x berolinensis]|nr:2-oxoglutarate-dependent dioxygenase AOP1.2 [Populus alba x Populus x berolinensis]
MKYQLRQITEPTYTLKSHTDKNLITILYQNQVDGLEVQTKHGEWIGVELSQDHSFVVLIGESFRAWTNGRLQPPYHRVRVSGSEARYSAGLFSVFKAGYKTKTPEDLIDEDHPLLYKPFDYFEFLKFLGDWEPKAQPNQCAFKAYCGV